MAATVISTTFRPMRRASERRTCVGAPSVIIRKVGAMARGFMMGSSVATTSSRLLPNALNRLISSMGAKCSEKRPRRTRGRGIFSAMPGFLGKGACGHGLVAGKPRRQAWAAWPRARGGMAVRG